VVEGELERDAIEQPQHHRSGFLDLDPPELAGGDALREPRTDQPAGARVGLPVHRGEAAVVERLAPELDEHGPEVAAMDRGLEAPPDHRAEPPARVPGPAGLRGHATIEVGGHPQGRRGQHRGLVAEVVVEDTRTHGSLRGDPLHGEARVPVAG